MLALNTLAPLFGTLAALTLLALLLFPRALIMSVIFSAAILLHYFLTMQHPLNKHVHIVTSVTNVTSLGFVVEIENQNVLVSTNEIVNIFDVVEIDGLAVPLENRSPSFDLETYGANLNIYSTIKNGEVTIVAKTRDVRVALSNYLQAAPEPYRYLMPLLVLGLKTKGASNFYQNALALNVLHLFVISGFHISLLNKSIIKLLTLCKINVRYGTFIATLCCWTYLFFLNFPIAATRAVIFVTLNNFDKALSKKRLGTSQCLGLTLGISAAVKPHALASLSFILTFLTTYAISLVSGYPFKKKWKKFSAISVAAYAVSTPVIVSVNHFWSTLGYFWGVLLTPVFTVFYLMVIVALPLKTWLNELIKVFEWLVSNAAKITPLVTVEPWPNLVTILYGSAFGLALIKIMSARREIKAYQIAQKSP